MAKRALSGKSNLVDHVQLTGWPTPDAQDFGSHDSRWEERREEVRAKKINGNGFGLTLGMAATLAGWPTPTGQDNDQVAGEYATNGTTLGGAVRLAGWATPGAQPNFSGDGEDPARWMERQEEARKRNPKLSGLHMPLETMVRLASGTPSASPPAGTAKSGVLNPAHSRWLQGFPATWDHCSPGWKAWTLIQSALLEGTGSGG
jgi:hypothetical protein